jgi:cobalamin biosynthesis protein CobD/CbiB
VFCLFCLFVLVVWFCFIYCGSVLFCFVLFCFGCLVVFVCLFVTSFVCICLLLCLFVLFVLFVLFDLSLFVFVLTIHFQHGLRESVGGDAGDGARRSLSHFGIVRRSGRTLRRADGHRSQIARQEAQG